MSAITNTVTDAATMTVDVATADIPAVAAMIKDFRAQIKDLNAQKTTIIKKFNRNCETIKTLRADKATLEAEKAAMQQTFEGMQALLGGLAGPVANDGLANTAVETANNGGGGGGAGGDMPQNIRQVTVMNVLRYFFRKVWESWGTNPHQAPAHVYGLGFVIMLIWVFGSFSVAVWEASYGEERWGLVLCKGIVASLPALFQFMLYYFPAVRARF